MPNPNENPSQGGGNPGHGGGPAPVTIYVNGTAYEVPKEKISYEELLQLIGAPPLPEGKRYSVVYSKGNSGKPTGTLLEGQSVEVKKDMEFDVTPANRS
jgi:Multiubiquitin